MGAIRVLFLLCLQLKLSTVSVVFDFNASLNGFTPVSPMVFPIDLMRMGNSVLFMNAIYVLLLFVFTTHIELHECCV